MGSHRGIFAPQRASPIFSTSNLGFDYPMGHFCPLIQAFFTSTKPQFLYSLPYKSNRLAVQFFFGTGIAALLQTYIFIFKNALFFKFLPT